MKRFLIILTVLMLLVPCALSEDTDAEALRSFLEQHYGIDILMGDEVTVPAAPNYEIRNIPEGNSPFQQVYYGNTRFADLLKTMDDVFSVYPPEFFSHFPVPGYRDKLRFLLVDEVLFDGMRISGYQTMKNGYFDIILGKNDAKERAIHHEIWHAIEYRIMCEDQNAFDGWAALNPEGFEYTGDFTIIADGTDDLEPDDWFAREYSKSDAYEDRATVFDAIMTQAEAWWNTRPHLQEKARFLLDKAEPIFGDLFPGE